MKAAVLFSAAQVFLLGKVQFRCQIIHYNGLVEIYEKLSELRIRKLLFYENSFGKRKSKATTI